MFDLIEEEKSKIPLRSSAAQQAQQEGQGLPVIIDSLISQEVLFQVPTYLLTRTIGGTTLKDVSLVLPLAIIEYQRVGACIESPFARPLLALVRKQPSTTQQRLAVLLLLLLLWPRPSRAQPPKGRQQHQQQQQQSSKSLLQCRTARAVSFGRGQSSRPRHNIQRKPGLQHCHCILYSKF